MDQKWAWWPATGESVRLIGRTELWGTPLCDAVSEATQRLHRIPASELRPLATRMWVSTEVVWRASAARAVALAAAGEPLAVRSQRFELLPHQLATLERAMAAMPVRLAICDEVGLGKTITAAAVAAELKARGIVRRTLVVAPKGVQLQWVAELGGRARRPLR